MMVLMEEMFPRLDMLGSVSGVISTGFDEYSMLTNDGMRILLCGSQKGMLGVVSGISL